MLKYKNLSIVSPSIMLGVRDEMDISKGVNHLESLGCNVFVAPSVYTGIKKINGFGQEKAQDIMNAYNNTEVDALVAAHGGAGSLKVVEFLDYEQIKKANKPFIGFSDSTAMQMAIFAKTGVPYITGYFPEYEFRGGLDISPLVSKYLQNVLEGKKFDEVSGDCAISGVAEGTLIGGNLSGIANLCGTTYFPDIADAILLIEDECEQSYKISLMLTELKLSPNFSKVKGIVFGRFSECEDHPTQGGVDELIDDFIATLDIPVIKNFNYGHFKDRFVLTCGVKYKLDANNARLTEL